MSKIPTNEIVESKNNNECHQQNSTLPEGNNQLSNPAPKRRRIRTAFTPWQLAMMEAQFGVQQYLVGEERQKFADALELNQVQVKVWFQNRRIRFRREEQQQKGQKKPKNG